MTLAYVFWHWTDAPVAPYLEAQRAFHAALAAHRPQGFRGSDSAEVTGAPWAPPGRAFEDRYFVEDFAALGSLNASAVEGARKEPHDRAAARAAGGCAGLYLLRSGDAFGPETGAAAWISKPAGTPYATFLESLRPELGKRGVSLWQRQMVLGPTPEFCLRASSAPDLPGLTVAAIVPFRRVLGGEELAPPPEDQGFPLA
jgi:hypothetical protein